MFAQHALEAACCVGITCAMRAVLESKMGRTEIKMRWMCGICLKERQPSSKLGICLKDAFRHVMRRGRLRWHGHVERKDGADYIAVNMGRKKCGTFSSFRWL